MSTKLRTGVTVVAKNSGGGVEEVSRGAGGDGAPGVRELAEVVSSRRRAMRLTLQALADTVGCAKSTLWKIERGVAPAGTLAPKLEEALNLEPGSLTLAAAWARMDPALRGQMEEIRGRQRAAGRLAAILRSGGIGPDGRVRGSLDAAYRSGELRRLVDEVGGAPVEGTEAALGARRASVAEGLPVEVPLINSVAAGYPAAFTDLGYPARTAAQYVRTLDVGDPDAFAARVVGDSMLPEYREGDIVVFSPAREVRSGMDCFARLEPDHETTFKRVYIEEGGESIRLQPLNSAYPPRVVGREQVAGLYPAVSVTRTIG